MSELFNRAVQVTIGQRDKDGIQIRNLRISFSVEKTNEKQPNPAVIKIWNLSRQSRAIIEQRKAAIILEAGYGEWRSDTLGNERFSGDLKKLFTGDIAQVVTERSGADIITTIEAGDGEQAYNFARMDASYKPGTQVGQVMDGILSSFGLTRGSVLGLNQNDQFQNGLSLSGPTRDHMSAIAQRQGLEWSIQDNQLQILPPTEGTEQEAVLLNQATGLIGSPYKTVIVNQDLLQKKDGKNAASGVQVRSLLNPELRPGRYVKVESHLVNGVFRVRSVTHAGDTHAGEYYSNVEAVI